MFTRRRVTGYRSQPEPARNIPDIVVMKGFSRFFSRTVISCKYLNILNIFCYFKFLFCGFSFVNFVFYRLDNNAIKREMDKKNQNENVVNCSLNKESLSRREWLMNISAEERAAKLLEVYPCFKDHVEVDKYILTHQ